MMVYAARPRDVVVSRVRTPEASNGVYLPQRDHLDYPATGRVLAAGREAVEHGIEPGQQVVLRKLSGMSAHAKQGSYVYSLDLSDVMAVVVSDAP